MRVNEMDSAQEDGGNGSSSTMIPWSSETNWVVAHGSLENSVSIESHDCPISEYDPEENRKSPLVLKSPGPDFGPCEIKICFRQKYDISQIYIRSTARVYEIYYAHTPESSIEYLCTVRCGVAERDEKLLQATCIEDADKEPGERFIGESAEEIIVDGRNIVPGEDDWIKIKAPEDGRNSSPDMDNVNTVQNIQDLYEATAQISDADPCSLLVIRLLSLQDKSQVYVDEVYAFVDPVESADSGNEVVPFGSVTQSPLMAMLVPTLLQLSRSGVSRAQDKHSSGKDENLETGSSRNNEVDVGLEKHQVDQNVKQKDLNQDEAESAQNRQPTTALNMEKCADPINTTYLPPGQLEIALDQLISRVSRVEDICLRFEEKLLKPIESMEARLQRFEHQLESRLQQMECQLKKLTESSHYSGLPNGTRISAPPFSCSESISSSFHSDGNEHTTCGVLEPGKKGLVCNEIPDSSHEGNIRPSLVVSAPEFSCGEDEDENEDLEPLKYSSCPKPKQTLSVDEALAAALSGFLSTAKLHPSDHMQTTSSLSSEVNENDQESCQMKMGSFPAADNDNKGPKQFAEEIGDEEEPLDKRQSSPATECVRTNEDDHGCNASGSDTNSSTPDLRSASNHSIPIVSGQLNDMSDLTILHSSYNENAVEISDNSCPELLEMDKTKISDKIRPRETNSASNDHDGNEGGHVSEGVVAIVLENYIAVEKHDIEDDSSNVCESLSPSQLDFEFPILEVKFTSDGHSSAKPPLEALLDGEAESNIQSCIHDNGNVERTSDILVESNEISDLLPSNHLLIDVGISAADELDDGQEQVSLSSPEVIVSLI